MADEREWLLLELCCLVAEGCLSVFSGDLKVGVFTSVGTLWRLCVVVKFEEECWCCA